MTKYIETLPQLMATKNLEKADMVKENFKLKIKNPRINNSIETKNIGSEINKWSLYKNQETKNKKRK